MHPSRWWRCTLIAVWASRPHESQPRRLRHNQNVPLPSRWAAAVGILLFIGSCSIADEPKKNLLLGQKPDGHPPGAHEYLAAQIPQDEAAKSSRALVLKGHTDRLTDVAFSPDGYRLATSSFDGTVRLWNAKSAEQVLAFEGHGRNNILGIDYSPDGERIVSRSESGEVKVWNSYCGAPSDFDSIREPPGYNRSRKDTCLIASFMRTCNP